MTTELYLSYPHHSKARTHLLYVYCTAVKRQHTSSTSIDKYIYVHVYICIFIIREFIHVAKFVDTSFTSISIDKLQLTKLNKPSAKL